MYNTSSGLWRHSKCKKCSNHWKYSGYSITMCLIQTLESCPSQHRHGDVLCVDWEGRGGIRRAATVVRRSKRPSISANTHNQNVCGRRSMRMFVVTHSDRTALAVDGP